MLSWPKYDILSPPLGMLTMNAIYCFECKANVFDVFQMYALYFNKKKKKKIYIYIYIF